MENCTVRFDVATSDVLLASLHLMSAVATVFSNIIILISFYQTRALRTISNFFVVSLAVSDLFVGLAVNPVYVAVHTTGITIDFSRVWPVRLAENWLWIQTLITSTFNLTAISVDRYTAVTNTFRYTQIITKERCIFGAAFIWTFSILFASTRFLIHDIRYVPILWLNTTIFMVLLPLLVISYCYFHILRAARQQQRQIAVLSCVNPAHGSAVQLKNKKAAWTIGIIVGLFVLLWTPNLAISFGDVALVGSCKRLYLVIAWHFAAFVSFLSSCCNPWVYAARSREFRAAFKRVFRPRRNGISDQLALSLRSSYSARRAVVQSIDL